MTVESALAAILTEWKAQIAAASSPQKIWVACSGGLDSTVLFFLLDRLQRAVQSFELVVLHVNYSLRGEESNRDEAAVRLLAETYGREIRVLTIDPAQHPPSRSGIQEWARDIRYTWFGKQQGPTDWLAVAHHKDDLIETILARLCRGHSLLALSGMQVMHNRTWRPLLAWTRLELQDFATTQQLHWCEDSSNNSLDYTRNRLRQKVLPELQELFPGVADNLWTHAQDLADCLSYIRQQFPVLPQNTSLGLGQLQGMPPFLARHTINDFLKQQLPNFKAKRAMLLEIHSALESGSRLERTLGPGVRLLCHKGLLSLDRQELPKSARWLQYQAALLDESLQQWPAVGRSKTKAP